MTARQRLIPALVGLLAFTLLGTAVSHHFWSQWWFYVGLGMALAVVFVEPFYGRAQDAIINAAGGVGAWASAARTPVEGLWWAYFAFVVSVAVLGGYAALAPESQGRAPRLAKRGANLAAGRLGRAVIIGGLALGVEVISLARRGIPGYTSLAIGTAILLGALTPNWPRALRLVTGHEVEPITALAATGPRLLLVVTEEPLAVGTRVSVIGELGGSQGWVMAQLPGESGPRCEVALDRDVSEVCRRLPGAVLLEPRSGGPVVVGSVGAGSTDLQVVFTPMAALEVGDPLHVGDENDGRLYQVSDLELRRETWLGDTSVVPQAVAIQVGRPEGGHVLTRPRLPAAHELVSRADKLAQKLPTGYVRLGLMKGTDVEIGIDAQSPDTGHFAILGISGMGKTSVALAICRALSKNCCVIALDTTGEYRTRQGIPVHIPGSQPSPGFWVHEPGGDPPLAAKKYLEQTMQDAYNEYVSGTPARRVLLLEEAHGFVPEGNLSTWPQKEATGESTRFIMQARKFELRFVMVSQRTAVVSKSALSQCENYVALRSTDETSLVYLEAALGRGIRQVLPRLQRYEAICMGPAFNTDGPVIVTLDPPPATPSHPPVAATAPMAGP